MNSKLFVLQNGKKKQNKQSYEVKTHATKMLKLFSTTVGSDIKYLVYEHNREVTVVDFSTDV